MINLILLTCIVVFIVDISGIVDEFKTKLSKWSSKGKMITTDFRIKPFDCSLCMTFWTGLIYILCTGFTIPMLAFVCLMAFSTDLIKEILLTIDDLIRKLISKI